MAVLDTKECLSCGKALKGRIDKKFCDDYCRNNYNNQQKAKSNHSNMVRNINNALLKNRKILESILASGGGQDTVKANRDKLLQLGFHFKYFTQLYVAKNGNTYQYCYDYGYRELENDWYLIVRNKDE